MREEAMGTKNNPGAFDCYAAAELDEPMFVLLGRDKHAPMLVWLWASLRELDGEDPAKVAEARECFVAMMKWATDHKRPVCGIGQATLAGVMEMIRTINGLVKETGIESKTNPTGDETFRRFLCQTTFEAP